MARQLSLGGEKIDLTLRRGKNAYEVAYGDDQYQVSLVEKGPDRYLLEVNGVISPVWIKVAGNRLFVHLNGRNRVLELTDTGGKSGQSGGAAGQLSAPMPGTVISVAVTEGDRVQTGQTLMVIESMKMETGIKATDQAVVKKLHFQLGDTFDRNAVLVSLDLTGSEDA